jgi:hypothetical protein
MPVLDQPLPLLGRLGLFHVAKAYVQDGTYETLKAKFDEHVHEDRLKDALLVAQKISILYGLQGLYLYLPFKLEMLREAHAEHDMIAQALIQTLSLILFVETNLGPDERSLHAWTVLQKNACLALCEGQDKHDIVSEADRLVSCYMMG